MKRLPVLPMPTNPMDEDAVHDALAPRRWERMKEYFFGGMRPMAACGVGGQSDAEVKVPASMVGAVGMTAGCGFASAASGAQRARRAAAAAAQRRAKPTLHSVIFTASRSAHLVGYPR